MSNDFIEKVNQLPLDKQIEVENFVNFLMSQYIAGTADTRTIAEKRKLNLGWAKGQIWISDDFNDTPEDFNDYI